MDTGMILTIGRNEGLLRTRIAVLRQADTQVVGVFPENAEAALRDQSFDLVVLCHTLTDKEMVTFTEMAFDTQGRIKIIRLETFGRPISIDSALHVNGRMSPEPEMLVKEVQNFLKSKKLSVM
jgi:hypothetical protein